VQGKTVVPGELLDFFPPLSFLFHTVCDAGQAGNVLQAREMHRVSCFRGKLGKIQHGNMRLWLLMGELIVERAA
jgi:hypothetical protein